MKHVVRTSFYLQVDKRVVYATIFNTKTLARSASYIDYSFLHFSHCNLASSNKQFMSVILNNTIYSAVMRIRLYIVWRELIFSSQYYYQKKLKESLKRFARDHHPQFLFLSWRRRKTKLTTINRKKGISRPSLDLRNMPYRLSITKLLMVILKSIIMLKALTAILFQLEHHFIHNELWHIHNHRVLHRSELIFLTLMVTQPCF